MRLLLILFIPLFSFAQAEKEKRALQQMMSACENLKSASFILSTTEKNKSGVMEKGEMLVKLSHVPLKIYLHVYFPGAHAEILYRKGMLNDELYISPNAFPYVNLTLSPNNLTVRKNGHHTVCDIGFDYVCNMIRHYQPLMGEKLYDHYQLGDTVEWDHHRCVKMEFDYPDFGYVKQVAQKGEDAVGIAARNFVNEYMIVCANPEVDDIHDVKAGQSVRVPNMFGRKIIFLVDLKTMLPLVQEIYDEKGLFEKYEYKSFILNPSFDPAEFTEEYKDYGF